MKILKPNFWNLQCNSYSWLKSNNFSWNIHILIKYILSLLCIGQNYHYLKLAVVTNHVYIHVLFKFQTLDRSGFQTYIESQIWVHTFCMVSYPIEQFLRVYYPSNHFCGVSDPLNNLRGILDPSVYISAGYQTLGNKLWIWISLGIGKKLGYDSGVRVVDSWNNRNPMLLSLKASML
jgi:hypothetical protein